MRQLFAAVCVLGVLGLSSPASADSFTNRPGQEWYGWQIIANDAGGLVLVIGAVATAGRSQTTAQLMLGGTALAWGLGGPAIHWAHGKRTTAWKSLALRWGLPIALGGTIALAASAGASDDCEEYCLADAGAGVVFGALVGGLIAQGVDWFGWSFRDKRPRARAQPATLTPSVMPVSGGGMMILGGSF